MDTLFQDLKFALRLLVKDRAFAVTTILTLALCIGANTAIFTVVQSVLLRPLPYPAADRLVFEYVSLPGAGVERAGTSVPNYFDRLAFTEVLESQALYRFEGFKVGSGPSAEDVRSLEVTPSFFRVLRAQAVRGRLFTDDEGEVGHNHVALLSHTFAAKQAGGIDAIVGRTLRLKPTSRISSSAFWRRASRSSIRTCASSRRWRSMQRPVRRKRATARTIRWLAGLRWAPRWSRHGHGLTP